MSAPVIHRLPVGEGWELTLTESPPDPAPFQIVAVVDGRGLWSRANEERDLEPAVPWWSGAGHDQLWSAKTPSRWLCLATDHCPLAVAGEEGGGRVVRSCPAVASDVKELVSIVTDCPYPCELKNLLTRGKSLMLVSKTLASLSSAPEKYAVRFFEGDFDRVRQARDLLLAQMASPPTVPDLARLVGLNEVKLKAGFHKLWGTTVYGLLRKERLDEARRFLMAGQGNVGEAAFRVGYTNTSHFAQAFQKEFGVSPGSLRSH